jgi:drug/metabolite transporter (DMT)-like permease
MTAEMKRRNLVILIAAFAAVYIFWGSTYLAIKYAIATLPPFLMAGTRFAIAGAILFAIARFSSEYERPTAKHWKTSFIVGSLLLLGGNGGVVIAQHFIPSSLAALLVATEPLWIVILSWLWLRTGRPGWKVVLGIVIGFAGVWLLISGKGAASASDTSALGQMIGAGAVILGALFWATGSIYGLRSPVPKSSLLTAGMQMLAGSIPLLLVGVVRGEAASLDASAFSAESIYAMIYLIVFGSLVGFTAYSWLLKNARPTIVATYAYINPIVAVLLGWGLAGETLTGQMLLGAAIIVLSVALVTTQKKEAAVPRTDEAQKRSPRRSGESRALSTAA